MNILAISIFLETVI